MYCDSERRVEVAIYLSLHNLLAKSSKLITMLDSLLSSAPLT